VQFFFRFLSRRHLPLAGLVKPSIVDRDSGLSCQSHQDAFGPFSEHPGLRVPEKQSA
jgi:hypothetical protein